MRKSRCKQGFTGVEIVITLAIVLILGVIIITFFRSAVDSAREVEALSVLRLCNLTATGCYTELVAENAFPTGEEVVLAYPPWYEGETMPDYMKRFARRFEGFLGEDIDTERIALTLTATAGDEPSSLLIRYYPDGRGSGAYYLWDGGTITKSTK